MTEQMLDLDCHIVGHRRMSAVKFVNDPHRMCGTVEKIGVSKRDVSGTFSHLLFDVPQNNLGLDDAELAFVDGHHGTMTTEVKTPAARLGVARNQSVALETQGGVGSKRGEQRAVGH